MWLCHHLSRYPEPTAGDVDDGFFPGERTRTVLGYLIYAAAGVLGYVVFPATTLVIFVDLPIFYSLTSEGLYNLPDVVRRSSS